MTDQLLKREKQKEASKRYRLKHPKKVKAGLAQWREKNPGHSTKWYRENLEKARNGERLRSKTPEYRRRNLAKQRVLRAVRAGMLTKPSVCPECGRSDKPIHGHHPDYSRPLEVHWLCRDCHVEVHYHNTT